jgi:hypothetical protein
MDHEEQPVGLRDVHKRDVVVSLEARTAEGQRKEASVTMVQPEGGTFEIVCDEGAYLGGKGEAPSPLAYFSAALAF